MSQMQMADASPTGAAAAAGANRIFVPPERQQLIGIKSVPAVRKDLAREVRTVGKIAYDETKVTHIHAKFTGYIEEVFADFVGQVVRKGQPLFTVYSPDLVATQEEHLLALKSQRELTNSQFEWVSRGSDNLLEASRRRLELWDVDPQEIEELQRTGKVKRALTMHSPVDGIVTARAAYHHGRYVTPETELYTIADLSTVWVLADAYEYELPFIREGQMTEIEFPYSGGSKNLRGKVVYVYPFLNPKTRTAQVRMQFPNPDLSLKPEMFVNVRLKTNLGRQLVVPEDAVLDTGTQQYVFVDLGDGYFEPRLVKLGPEAEGNFVIESGLKPNERVVTAANFILDSESRLRGAFANLGKPSAEQAQAGAKAKAVQVEILEPKQAKVGKNNIRLRVKDASGNPVEGAQVTVRLFMPQMGTMPPMATTADLQHVGGGAYAGTIEVMMAWTWETTVTVKKDGQVVGTAMTTVTAR